jgi:hypothetical protein
MLSLQHVSCKTQDLRIHVDGLSCAPASSGLDVMNIGAAMAGMRRPRQEAGILEDVDMAFQTLCLEWIRWVPSRYSTRRAYLSAYTSNRTSVVARFA